MNKNLECSSRGDKRFSAFYARIDIFGMKNVSIEDVYQKCKRFGDDTEYSTREAKGKTPTHMHVFGVDMELKYLTPFYRLLWVKYLDAHPELVAYASEFDTFSDMFRGRNTLNCQADCVRDYVKYGRAFIMNECREFIDEYKKLQALK